MFNAARLNSVGYLLCVSILDGTYHCDKNVTARGQAKCCEEKRAEIGMARLVGVSV